MHIIAYLHFPGQAEEALNYYKAVTGGVIVMVSRMGEGPMDIPGHLKNKIMHARLQIGDSVLYISDTFEESQVIKGNNISLSLQVETTAQVDNLFALLSEGGKPTMPPNDAFWGARFSMLEDKFGVHWMVSCPLEEKGKDDSL